MKRFILLAVMLFCAWGVQAQIVSSTSRLRVKQTQWYAGGGIIVPTKDSVEPGLMAEVGFRRFINEKPFFWGGEFGLSGFSLKSYYDDNSFCFVPFAMGKAGYQIELNSILIVPQIGLGIQYDLGYYDDISDIVKVDLGVEYGHFGGFAGFMVMGAPHVSFLTLGVIYKF